MEEHCDIVPCSAAKTDNRQYNWKIISIVACGVVLVGLLVYVGYKHVSGTNKKVVQLEGKVAALMERSKQPPAMTVVQPQTPPFFVQQPQRVVIPEPVVVMAPTKPSEDDPKVLDKELSEELGELKQQPEPVQEEEGRIDHEEQATV